MLKWKITAVWPISKPQTEGWGSFICMQKVVISISNEQDTTECLKIAVWTRIHQPPILMSPDHIATGAKAPSAPGHPAPKIHPKTKVSSEKRHVLFCISQTYDTRVCIKSPEQRNQSSAAFRTHTDPGWCTFKHVHPAWLPWRRVAYTHAHTHAEEN